MITQEKHTWHNLSLVILGCMRTCVSRQTGAGVVVAQVQAGGAIVAQRHVGLLMDVTEALLQLTEATYRVSTDDTHIHTHTEEYEGGHTVRE